MYFIFGKLVLFIAGIGVGAIVHSSWEIQRRGEKQLDGGLITWEGIGGKESREDLEVVKVSNLILS